MTIKTPEQIADDAMRDDKGDDIAPGDWWRGSCEEMRQIITAAIEADRAQRAEAEEAARASLAEYWEKSEWDSFEAIDGMEWAEELASILDGLVTK